MIKLDPDDNGQGKLTVASAFCPILREQRMLAVGLSQKLFLKGKAGQ